MSRIREGWFAVQGAIGYAVVYPWCCHLFNVKPWNVWWFSLFIFSIGAIWTLISEAETKETG